MIKKTEQYSPNLMANHYLVHASIREYVWFETYDEARDYLMSEWVDHRIATEIYTPAK